MSKLNYELTKRQEEDFIPLILAGKSDAVLRQLYMKLRFRLFTEPEKYLYFPHWRTSPEEVEQRLEEIRALGFTENATKQPYRDKYGSDNNGTRTICRANCGAFRMKFIIYHGVYEWNNELHGYRFALTTPAGDTWNYIASTGCKDVTDFIHRCMDKWEQWEQAWQHYLVRVQKLRKRDSIGKFSLDLILKRLGELRPGSFSTSNKAGRTALNFRLHNAQQLKLTIPHDANMSTLTGLPEELTELCEALNALSPYRFTNCRDTDYSPFF